jgi:hypothetical protein
MTDLAIARTGNLLSTIRGVKGRTKKALMAVAAGTAATLGVAAAFTTPATGQLGYEIYNVVVNQMIDGPIGILASVLAFAFGAFSLLRGGYLSGVMSVVAGIALFTADDVVQSLGALV